MVYYVFRRSNFTDILIRNKIKKNVFGSVVTTFFWSVHFLNLKEGFRTLFVLPRKITDCQSETMHIIVSLGCQLHV